MDDKHDPNGSVPIGTFKATSEDGELEIPIEIVDDEDDVDTRQFAIQGDDVFLRHGDSPRRQRVNTLLGVPMPGAGLAGIGRAAGADAKDPRKASRREISAAVDEALDDERPTTIYGYKRDSLEELDKLVEAEMTEEIPASEATGEIIGVVGGSTDTGTYQIEVRESPRGSVPVLAPMQFVEARARDAKSQDEAARVEPATRAVATPTEPVTRAVAAKPDLTVREFARAERAGDEQPTAAIAPRAERMDQSRARVESEPALKKPEPPRSAGDRQSPGTVAQASVPEPLKKPISSLAPTEIKRSARPAATPREPASVIGYALVAAMVLLGLGGWFLTAGGYQRSTPAAAPPAAAASVARPADSLASSKLPSTPVTPPPVAEPAPAEQVAPAPSPAPAPSKATHGDGAPARPRVASKSVRKPAVAPPPSQVAEQAETPSREEVLSGLDRIRSRVRECAEGRNGVAEVDLTIAANGVVTNALVGGDFGGTPQGSCIARAVRKARFQPFKQDRYRVLFPYVL
jgi:hypothetical protein